MLMAIPFGRLVAAKDQSERRGNQHHGMGRTPCCDKLGIKKGPWTPEEDIILVSYIQQHGPGNWRSVPTHTGLLRCSKSCRLRWTNYLRPGIKRGNFTPHEEGIIIHLQALLGNKWAAIASYLPQRTDNDIKNYWNTHLKKKIKKLQMGSDSTSPDPFVSKGVLEKGNLDIGNTSTTHSLNHSYPAIYASSTENISRLLEGWMRSSSSQYNMKPSSCATSTTFRNSKGPKDEVEGDNPISNEDQEGFESMISFNNLNGIGSWDKMEANIQKKDYYDNHENIMYLLQDRKAVASESNNPTPLSLFEKWLLDETAVQLEETPELPVIS